jgi:hypothetical protein
VAERVGPGQHQDRIAQRILALQRDRDAGDPGLAVAAAVAVVVGIDVDIARERAGRQLAKGVGLAKRMLADNDAGDAIVGQPPAQGAERVQSIGISGRLGLTQGVDPRLQIGGN